MGIKEQCKEYLDDYLNGKIQVNAIARLLGCKSHHISVAFNDLLNDRIKNPIKNTIENYPKIPPAKLIAELERIKDDSFLIKDWDNLTEKQKQKYL